MIKQYAPFLDWIPKYRKRHLSGDISAGLTVGVMLIPQGMAYALLAGMPPIYGLYAATLPLILYALFGTSGQLAVGPTAMMSLLIAGGIGSLELAGPEQYIVYAISLALMVGLFQLLMGVFRLGFLVNFLSQPVIGGYTLAAAIIIAASQLRHLLGLEIPRGRVDQILVNVFQHLQGIHLPTLWVGLGSMALLVIIRRINRRIPGPLVVVVLGIVLSYGLDLEKWGIAVVGDIPAGLPALSLPTVNLDLLQTLWPAGLTLALVGFMESIAVGKAVQTPEEQRRVVPNQELIALGLANISGAFVQAFPVTGGFSRTAVNYQSGAKTGLASMISAALMMLTLLLLTPYFSYLPTPVLAAIIMVAVSRLINFSNAKQLWQVDRKDFLLFSFTALSTLLIGVQQGILLGVILSVLVILYSLSYPHIAQLGRIPGTQEYRNLKRFDQLETWDEIVIMRFDAQLYFANLAVFRQSLADMIDQQAGVRYAILDFKPINNVDSSALKMLAELITIYQQRSITLLFADVKGPIRDQFKKVGLLDQAGTEHIFLTVDEAVKSVLENRPSPHHKVATQSLIKE